MYGLTSFSETPYAGFVDPLPTSAILDGVAGTLGLGTVAVQTNNFISVTGVGATGGLGTISLVLNISVSITAPNAINGKIGTLLLWQTVDDEQDAQWTIVQN
tara:strand:- start:1113 stop:1418 length:306 start_codon:yes stop_codon:yes gene_type:complete